MRPVGTGQLRHGYALADERQGGDAAIAATSDTARISGASWDERKGSDQQYMRDGKMGTSTHSLADGNAPDQVQAKESNCWLCLGQQYA